MKDPRQKAENDPRTLGERVASFQQVSFLLSPADAGHAGEPSNSRDAALAVQTVRTQFETQLCHLEVIGTHCASSSFLLPGDGSDIPGGRLMEEMSGTEDSAQHWCPSTQ